MKGGRNPLTALEEQQIVTAARYQVENLYCNLIQKQDEFHIDPTTAFDALEQKIKPNGLPEMEFHSQMRQIYVSFRDLHTQYLLPFPYSTYIASLPFELAYYYTPGSKIRFCISELLDGAPAGLAVGDLVVSWNGGTMKDAIINAKAQSQGSNNAAQLARARDWMTYRVLARQEFPSEEIVTFTVMTDSSVVKEYSATWTITESATLQSPNRNPLHFVSPKTKVRTPFPVSSNPGWEGIFQYASLEGGSIGYIQILMFAIPPGKQKKDFSLEFQRIVKIELQNPYGIMIDVRSTSGGDNLIAEDLLRYLRPSEADITRAFAQFIVKKGTVELLKNPSKGVSAAFAPWTATIDKSVKEGAEYSEAFENPSLGALQGNFQGKKLLLCDAESFSSTCTFCAGFQDNLCGQIMGVDAKTGGGGANVFRYDMLRKLFATVPPELPAELPYGTDFRLALRRVLRGTGPLKGQHIEGTAITPDIIQRPTRYDILNNFSDFFDKAVAILSTPSASI